MIYRITSEMENVVELGWYGEHKRHSMEDNDQQALGEEMRKNKRVMICNLKLGKRLSL